MSRRTLPKTSTLAAAIVLAICAMFVVPVASAVPAFTATIVVADTSLLAGETSLVTFTFSEAVTGFDNADLTIANGTLSAVSSSDAVTWTATLTPTAGIADATNLITLTNTGVDGTSGAGVGTTDSNNYAINTVRPTASIVVSPSALTVDNGATATITFSEAVTGFSNADLTIANGTLSAVSSSNGGVTWTATLTPTDGVDDATNVITLANTGVANAAGNTGSGTTDSNNYTIDTVRPSASIVVADTSLTVGETSAVTITFNVAVRGFAGGALSVENGDLSTATTSDNITFTATLTPTAGVNDPTNVITLNNAGFESQSAARNGGSGTSVSNNYAVNTAPPVVPPVPATATITLADEALSVDETSLVTVTFSRAVSGLDNADLTVPHGTLTPVSSADGGTTWTATFTPTAGIEDATNVVTLDNSGVSEAGSGTTDSANYRIDTLRPTAGITVAKSDLGAGETSPVTITFTEAVTGLSNADLTIDNGTLSAVSSSDDGVTWTATLTPTSGVTVAGNVITLDDSGVADLAGNPGSGTTESNTYAVDTLAPSSSATGPSVTGKRTFPIRYVAGDDGSDVVSVDLYVHTPGTTGLALADTDSTTTDGHFSYTGARDGTYAFYTVATDAAGNVETAPDSPDGRTRVDTRDPALRAAMGSDPVTFSHSADRRVGLRFRASEQVSYQISVRRHGRALRTFDEQSSRHGLLQHGWRGRNDAGHRVRPGGYRVVVTATDAAGNRSRTGERLRIRR